MNEQRMNNVHDEEGTAPGGQAERGGGRPEYYLARADNLSVPGGPYLGRAGDLWEGTRAGAGGLSGSRGTLGRPGDLSVRPPRDLT